MKSHRLHTRLNDSFGQGLIIVGNALVIITVLTAMSINTIETTTDLPPIKMVPADWDPRLRQDFGGQAYQRLYDELLKPTVRINTKDGIGSGVIIHHRDIHPEPVAVQGKKDTENIYILTANHVVGNNTSVTVTVYSYISNTQVTLCELCAFVVMTDTNKDLALLATDTHGLTRTYSAKLARKDYQPFLFASVYAVGCSLGLPPRPSQGIITSISENQCSSVVIFWEISAPILPGNSGGPVFDSNTHEVIGIAVWVKTYYGQLITTMAGIVPINQIYDFLDEFYRKDAENAKTGYNYYILGELCVSVVNNSPVNRISLPDVSSRNVHACGTVYRQTGIKGTPDVPRNEFGVNRDLRTSKSLTLQLVLRGGEYNVSKSCKTDGDHANRGGEPGH